MADGAKIDDVESLVEFQAYLARFREELISLCDGISVEFQRMQRGLFQDAVVYWRTEGRKAEQRTAEARDALMLCRAKVRPDDHEACTEQQKQFENAKARLRLCEEKLKFLKACQTEWEHFAGQALPRLAEAVDLNETGIPRARSDLTSILDLIEKYRSGPG